MAESHFLLCLHGWVGHIYKKTAQDWGPGTQGFAFPFACSFPSGTPSTQKAPGGCARSQGSFNLNSKLKAAVHAKTLPLFWIPQGGCGGAISSCTSTDRSLQHLVKNTKPSFRGQAIQKPIFPTARTKTDFEGGGDGRGWFDRLIRSIEPTRPCHRKMRFCTQQQATWALGKRLCLCRSAQRLTTPGSLGRCAGRSRQEKSRCCGIARYKNNRARKCYDANCCQRGCLCMDVG